MSKTISGFFLPADLTILETFALRGCSELYEELSHSLITSNSSFGVGKPLAGGAGCEAVDREAQSALPTAGLCREHREPGRPSGSAACIK